MNETNVGKNSIMQALAASPASKIPDIAEQRFKHFYIMCNGNSKEAAAFFESEKYHFAKLLNESPGLKECTKLSLYGCILDVAVNGLSFDSNFKHLYLVPFNINVGTKDKPLWEKRAQLQISGYGELVLRIRQGQVKYVDNPILVYEDEIDNFSYGTKNGAGFVEHIAKLSTKQNRKIIACYLKITRTDGTIDFKVLTQDDMNRFMSYAKKDRQGNLGKAWTEGIGGMWQSKCIKHAFKNYVKVRTGKYSQLATETEEVMDGEVTTERMGMPDNMDYGIEEHASVPNKTEEAEYTETTTSSQEDKEFMEDDAKNKPAGNTVHIESSAEEEDEDF